MSGGAAGFIRAVLPKGLRRALVALTRRPPVGRVDLGDLRRLDPAGRGRGRPGADSVADHYALEFLREHAGSARGRVLELGGRGLAARLDVRASSADSLGVPTGPFDCIISCGALSGRPRAAAGLLRDALAPGGTLLAVLPGIVSDAGAGPGAPPDGWRFTAAAARLVFGDAFAGEEVSVTAHGNVLAATAILHELSAEDVGPERLAVRDDDFEVVVCVRAVRQGAP